MFAVLCTLSLVVPLVGPRVGAAVAGSVLLGAYVVTDGPLFDLLAYPGDYEDARLYGLITFVLAGVALGLMATAASMPQTVFVGTLLLVGYGNLGEQLVRLRTDDAVVRVTGFCLTGIAAAVAGQAATHALTDTAAPSATPILVFLAASGALLAALLRDVLLRSDDPIVVLAVGSCSGCSPNSVRPSRPGKSPSHSPLRSRSDTRPTLSRRPRSRGCSRACCWDW